MITQKMKYALKALLVLADEAEKGKPEPLTIEEIAKRSDTPKRFLEHILLEVRNAGVIASIRGRAGGYFLVKKPTEVSISELLRTIDWRGAFWVASGVPALLLFSMGGIAGTTGKLAFLVWIISMIMGFLQSFTYAEIAGLFGSKSGGASVYGATAWLRCSTRRAQCCLCIARAACTARSRRSPF